MKAQVHFNHIQTSESVQNFVNERLQSICEKFELDQERVFVDVYLRVIRGRTELRHPLFECECVIRPSFTKAVIKVTRTEEDLYKAIENAIKSVNTAFSKKISKRNDHHKYLP